MAWTVSKLACRVRICTPLSGLSDLTECHQRAMWYILCCLFWAFWLFIVTWIASYWFNKYKCIVNDTMICALCATLAPIVRIWRIVYFISTWKWNEFKSLITFGMSEDHISRTLSAKRQVIDYRPVSHHNLFQSDSTFDVRFGAIVHYNNVIDRTLKVVFESFHKNLFNKLCQDLRNRNESAINIAFVSTG